MNILITGGLGLVGTEIIKEFKKLHVHQLKDEYTLVVVDNMLYTNDFLDDSIIFKRGDVGDYKFITELLKKYNFDVIIHLAGIVGDAACGHRPNEAKRANLDSLKILRDNFDGRIIWPSSCSVYGANDNIVTEESPFNPLSLYAEMKIQGEQILKDRPNTVILRLGTLHGVTGRFRSDLVVHILTVRALLEKQISVFGGDQYRPLLHVNDLTQTIVYDLLNPTIFGRQNITGTFNLVENNYKILDIAKIIQTEIPNALIKIVEMSFEDKRNYKVSAKKAKNTWGFSPKGSIIQTVQDIKRIYTEGRVKDFSHIKYSNILALKFKEKK